jgi:hypothetical protein
VSFHSFFRLVSCMQELNRSGEHHKLPGRSCPAKGEGELQRSDVSLHPKAVTGQVRCKVVDRLQSKPQPLEGLSHILFREGWARPGILFSTTR